MCTVLLHHTITKGWCVVVNLVVEAVGEAVLLFMHDRSAIYDYVWVSFSY